MKQLVVSAGQFSSHHFRPVFFRRLTFLDFFWFRPPPPLRWFYRRDRTNFKCTWTQFSRPLPSSRSADVLALPSSSPRSPLPWRPRDPLDMSLRRLPLLPDLLYQGGSSVTQALADVLLRGLTPCRRWGDSLRKIPWKTGLDQPVIPLILLLLQADMNTRRPQITQVLECMHRLHKSPMHAQITHHKLCSLLLPLGLGARIA